MIVRINLIQWTLVVLPFLAVAQPKQFVTSARSGDSVRQSRTVITPTETVTPSTEISSSSDTDATHISVNTLPLFGERPKTAAQIGEEIHFLNDCDRNFASRSEASDFFANRGWDYVANGQLDTAAYRFNLSWLLNDRNADAYWGLGVVCYQKNQLPDAIRMLKRGLAVADSNVVLMTDLATVEIKHYQDKANAEALTDAEKHLQRAIGISPANATSHQKLSVVYYLRADYAKAWDYLHQAHHLDLSSLDLGYVNELLAKQPDPKGIFK
ncbi:tetratricopeptide repeat protein [Spirosoma sp.]|uniref:tetratricopeptide repeat protein n=1 Tax=Spirosoma sp. TaxID=1899569 RepID=UPI003B3BBFC5